MKEFILTTTLKAGALLGLSGAYVLYFVLKAETQTSSPLVLLLLATLGVLIVKKQEMTGNLLMTLAGAALLIHPLLFDSSLGYTVAGIPLVAAGGIGLFRWWNV